jgi:hypothetical protein
MKWNDYSYGIVNHLFGMGIFLGIVIYIGITNLIHTGITIPLRNEWNNYSLWYGMNFTKKTLYYFLFLHFVFLHFLTLQTHIFLNLTLFLFSLFL